MMTDGVHFATYVLEKEVTGEDKEQGRRRDPWIQDVLLSGYECCMR